MQLLVRTGLPIRTDEFSKTKEQVCWLDERNKVRLEKAPFTKRVDMLLKASER